MFKEEENDWLAKELKEEGFVGCNIHSGEHAVLNPVNSNNAVLHEYNKEQFIMDKLWQQKEKRDDLYEEKIGIDPDSKFSLSKVFMKNLNEEIAIDKNKYQSYINTCKKQFSNKTNHFKNNKIISILFIIFFFFIMLPVLFDILMLLFSFF